MTPSDFELTRHPEFAKTYAYHLEINANRRPPAEKNHGFFTRGDHTDIICQYGLYGISEWCELNVVLGTIGIKED